jgi:hypothetical protein
MAMISAVNELDEFIPFSLSQIDNYWVEGVEGGLVGGGGRIGGIDGGNGSVS